MRISTFTSTVLALLFCLLGHFGQAQQPATITGTIQDQTGQPLAFATAVLLHLPDSAVAASQPTDALGHYRFDNVAPSRYFVKVLLLSYTPTRSAAFTVTAGERVTMPVMRLAAASTALGGVTIAGRPPVLEQQADRTVVHVDRLNTAGDNALEVLKKAPGIQLDKDERIIYRGRTGVTVLLDGKLTYMSGEALTSYLKSLPASAISQIELIPNPPASMDASGTAGVLNIRLRRSQLPGLSGTATAGAGYGRYEKVWGSTNLAYNVGKVRLFTRLDAGRFNSFNRLEMVRHIRDSVFRQENYWQPLTHSFNYAAGAEVAVGKRHLVGGQVRGGFMPVTAAVHSESVTTDAAGQFAGRLQMENPQTSQANNAGLNLNYRWTLDSLGHELTADADYVRYTATKDQTFSNLYFSPLSEVAQDAGQLRSDQSSDVTVRAAKVDYVHPFTGSAWRAEAGAKTSWVTTHSAIRFDKLLATDWQLDPLRTNQFQYDERIMAAYFSLGATLGHLEVKGGLRGEQTHSVGQSATTSQRVTRSYFQLFPSLFAAYKIDDHNQLGLSAGRRISRPTYSDLNPFLSYTDAYTAQLGNPFLAPSLAVSGVLNYTHKDFQVLSLSYLQETGAMNEVVYQNDVTKVTTSIPQNLDQIITLNLTSGGHSTLTKWWGADNQLGGSYSRVNTQVEGRVVQQARFGWSLSSDHTFTLPQHYILQVGGNYRSAAINGLFRMQPSGAFNVGLKKQLWQGKATLSLKASDLFYTDRWRSTLRYNNINMTWNNQYESRRIMLSFTSKIGSGKTLTRHPAGSNDEENRISR